MLLLLMACLLAACAASKVDKPNAASTLAAGSGDTEEADSLPMDGIAIPGGAGAAELTHAGSTSSTRFERVPEGIRDAEHELVWAAHDNGADVNWNDAQNHCAALGPGWSLPSITALRSLYDESGTHSQTIIVHEKMYTVKLVTPMISPSSLFLWTSEGNGSSEAWYVDLVNGSQAAATIDSTFARAMCVAKRS
ncbi:MAG: Lcl domain-containing protein [Pseudomarimonas sp.]